MVTPKGGDWLTQVEMDFIATCWDEENSKRPSRFREILPHFKNVARGKSKYGNRQKNIIESFVGLLETYAEHTEKLVEEKSDMLKVEFYEKQKLFHIDKVFVFEKMILGIHIF